MALEDRVRTLEEGSKKQDALIGMLVENDRHRVELAQENAVIMARMADAVDHLKEALTGSREAIMDKVNDRFLHATGQMNDQEKRFEDVKNTMREQSVTLSDHANFLKNFKWALGALYALLFVAATAAVTHAVNGWMGVKP